MAYSSFNRLDAFNSEFLHRIFQWEPEWFDNQNDVSTNDITQIIGDKYELLKTSLSYKNIEDYYKTMKPLMIYEFYHILLRDIEDEDAEFKRLNKKKNQCFIGTISSFCNKNITSIPGEKLKVIIIEGNVDFNDAKKIPQRGDLLHIKYLNTPKMFGYVDSLVKQKTVLFMKCVYTIITKDISLCINKQCSLTAVRSIQQNLRVIQALAELPNSPLYTSIIEPNYSDYSMSNADIKTILPLLFDQKLNDMQLKIVADIVKTVDDSEPKICLVQGPPGTGKSTAIVSMITELMKKNSNRKIILCAPSNKAIDAVLSKLLDAQIELEKKGIKLNIVRIGKEEKMDPKIQRVSLFNLALDSQLDNLSILKKNKKIRNYAAEEEILSNANIIVSTLMSSFTGQMENIYGFIEKIPICIIDEAGQSLEIESLIPLLLGVKTLILVGDPQQLPPTIISREAKVCGLDLSLFARAQKYFMEKSLNPIQMLNVQYRMTDEIAWWPNKYFYGGAIKNAANVLPLPLCNYKILIHNSPETYKQFTNQNEAIIIVNLLDVIITNYHKNEIQKLPSMSVITPYRHQLYAIMEIITDKKLEVIMALINEEYEKLDQYDKQDDSSDDSSDDDNASSCHSINDDIIKNILMTGLSTNEEYREKKKSKLNQKSVLKLKNQEFIEQSIRGKIINSKKFIENNNKSNNEKKETENLFIDFYVEDQILDTHKFFTTEEINDIEKILNEINSLKKLYEKWQSIEINTVDSFQGQEQDIIIMSCVRSKTLGFVANPNRLNVSLTRAKHTLILCGNFNSFKTNYMWRSLLINAEHRGACATVNHNTTLEDLKNLIFV